MVTAAVLAYVLAAQEPVSAQTLTLRAAAAAMEKAKDDTSLDRARRLAVVTEGIADADRVLSADAQNIAALVYKNLLLRYQAALVDDASQQDALIRLADDVREKAKSLRPQPAASAFEASPPDEFEAAAKRMNAVRGGSNVTLPRKVIDVRPEYPHATTAGGTIA